MTYDDLLSGLIPHVLASSGVQTHERLVLRRYSCEESTRIVARMLDHSEHASVGLAEDNGTITTLDALVFRCHVGLRDLEILPFVVNESPSDDAPPWCGSQGFASRLRTSFHNMVAPGTTRILLLFDGRPLETEHTTASEQLAATADSLPSLVNWFHSPLWRTGFVAEVYDLVSEVLHLWINTLAEEDAWRHVRHIRRLEQAAAFVESCRDESAVTGVGQHLPKLGVAFSDPALQSGAHLKARFGDNCTLAARLERIQQDGLIDPLVAADHLLDMGARGESFYDALAAALRSPDRSVVEAGVTYDELHARLRSQDRSPAWLDLANLTVTGLDSAGSIAEGSVAWEFLGEPDLPGCDGAPIELVCACPSDRVQIDFPVCGTLRSFLCRDGQAVRGALDDDGALVPGSSHSMLIDRPSPFCVYELTVSERPRGRGRPPRSTQVVRLAIVSGERVVLPHGATLDSARDCFVVDGSADVLTVRVGGTERLVSHDLPPEDCSPVDVTVDNVAFRWAGEDRAPSAGDETPNRPFVRLLEMQGLKEAGDPRAIRPFVTAPGGLAAAAQTSAILDVDPDWLRAEGQLLRSPRSFSGIAADNAAAEEEIRRCAPEFFDRWIEARQVFFEAICAHSEAVLKAEGDISPSLYLADLRTDNLGHLASQYVDFYAELLAAVAPPATQSANRALIEPVLLCDAAFASDDALSIAPSHPLGVALLATIQRGLLSSVWDDSHQRRALGQLLGRPLLAGVLPWLPWGQGVLDCHQRAPLLWRCYGTDGGTSDTSSQLALVIVAKIRRLLDLAPHLNEPDARVYLNVEIGEGPADYLIVALTELVRDKNVRCSFDVGVVCRPNAPEPTLARIFSCGPTTEGLSLRNKLNGSVRVCRLVAVADRPAHLHFRLAAAHSARQPLETLSTSHVLARDTGFCAGLSQEPVRFAVSTANEVVYRRYVNSQPFQFETPDIPLQESLWDGPWRRRYQRLVTAYRHAAVGLYSALHPDSIPCQSLRQVAGDTTGADYANSFITVHCDPAQGPEFFVGPRTARSGVFLVECSDLGAPSLPGRDIVSVTSRIGPFRSALAAAVSRLPSPLNQLVTDDVARGLLRDINILRGTEVFDFLRESARRDTHVHFMDGLDNVLALRLLLSPHFCLPDTLPIVMSMRDVTIRCQSLAALRRGTQCDDILVLYLSSDDSGTPLLRYRLIEVKFGPRRAQWQKAQQQISATAQKLSEHFPAGLWKDEPSPEALLLSRDLAWLVQETLERYRAFGLLPSDEDMESAWSLGALVRSLHAGLFALRPYDARDNRGDPVLINGTALMLDADIPGTSVERTVDCATEFVTIPCDIIAWALETAVPAFMDATRPFPREGTTRDAAASRAPDSPPLAAPIQAPALDARDEAPLRPLVQPAAAAPVDATAPVAPNPPAEAAPNEQRTEAVSALLAMTAQVDSVFTGFVGNTGLVTRLKRSIIIALLEQHLWLQPVGLFGPKSTGKTELARRIGRALNIPIAELSQATMRSADDLAIKLMATAREAESPIRLDVSPHGATVHVVPPMVLFIDEVHLLRGNTQDCLLKAMEPEDRTLLSTHGTFNTTHVTFIMATTDPGRLGDAFKSRLSRYDLREYSLDEVVAILVAHRDNAHDVPAEAGTFDNECLQIMARVGRLVPRQAIQRMKEAAREVHVGLLVPTAESLRRHYWDLYRADEMGLVDRDRAYLRLLFPDHVRGIDSLAAQLGEVKTTIESDIEPYLLRMGLIDRGSSGRGRSLTSRGREMVPRLVT